MWIPWFCCNFDRVIWGFEGLKWCCDFRFIETGQQLQRLSPIGLASGHNIHAKWKVAKYVTAEERCFDKTIDKRLRQKVHDWLEKFQRWNILILNKCWITSMFFWQIVAENWRKFQELWKSRKFNGYCFIGICQQYHLRPSKLLFVFPIHINYLRNFCDSYIGGKEVWHLSLLKGLKFGLFLWNAITMGVVMYDPTFALSPHRAS